MHVFGQIEHAQLDWQCVDGIDIPCSRQFGDVYFSKANGLLETRHVFLQGNELNTRLSELSDHQYFCVGETGFGTGLNILALWQLWREVRPQNHSHLHVVSVEKYPLSHSDLIRALNAWPELQPLAKQLIAQYPQPISGCHRLCFPQERFSLDLWLGDATDIFPVITSNTPIDAWFLDGFAPSCNPELWQENILKHMIRLSNQGTTFASFSVAGVLKRGLQAHGIQITRPRGFGHKREMLKGIWPHTTTSQHHAQFAQKDIAIIGAGIAGLTTAWAFAQRGHHVRIFEKTAPICGGSGNPLALINPKICPIEQAHEHLMVSSWQYAQNYYSAFKAFSLIAVEQNDLKHSGELHKIAQNYPHNTFTQLTLAHQNSLYPTATLMHAGAVRPHVLKDEILAHPNIQLCIADICEIQENEQSVMVIDQQKNRIQVDHVISCVATASHELFTAHPKLKPIRGQVSWFKTNTSPLKPQTALSYGGYMAQLDPTQLILGASFQPQRTDTEILLEDHAHNLTLLNQAYPNYSQHFPSISTWQGRSAIRAQSPDYFPIVGKIKEYTRVYTLSGLGSKGFLFAPLCAEVLAAEINGEVLPIPKSLYNKLTTQRFNKKKKAKKPYYQH
ncbi:FAD-dependent 5-carboxymethylaminomethyl-2-thiouridine(34) oxidoreductase MnmC [Acinetobacter sp. B5B]|uniref:FAD-dependent 5-carboxymethylaminomethyl-2-thiouridine(34) oxidoreductase MnmC n=1 Tax=Acinetobacter baretiae TaxID=2605383 RepID=UPI0018C2D2AC|nr:FAD-dependent 5-carboxymethylaminomethyl-2-thiouridine(34) oxidoreductase MnmC [Acinetobacter baretiae]MBF7683812.1 FAD-dependent 5-carboxymethylaminomethyl-2-thiouridine(34) oxidoreductase MnmC [Acinetobacter baretiae]